MKNLIMLLSLFILTSCSSGIMNKHYYRINSNYLPKKAVTVDKNSQIVWIAPIRLAGFLNQEGIVYQTKSSEYIIANNHLWRSPLAGQLQNILIDNLFVLLPNNLVLSMPVDSPGTTVNVFIDGFHGTYEGDVIVKGYWVIRTNNGEIKRKDFNHRIAQHKSGYGTLVETLSIGWQSEINDLVKDITSWFIFL